MGNCCPVAHSSVGLSSTLVTGRKQAVWNSFSPASSPAASLSASRVAERLENRRLYRSVENILRAPQKSINHSSSHPECLDTAQRVPKFLEVKTHRGGRDDLSYAWSATVCNPRQHCLFSGATDTLPEALRTLSAIRASH